MVVGHSLYSPPNKGRKKNVDHGHVQDNINIIFSIEHFEDYKS